MKTQMIIGGILFGVAACTAPADGYRITGNIEGAGDGKAILLQSAGFGEPTMGDTVNMRNGKFVFEGRLESPVSVTVKVCPDSDQPASLGFIAENSPIRVMAAWKDVIERYGYRSIGGQTVEGSLNQEVYEKIAGVYGQMLKAPEHKEYAEAQQKMAGLRNTDTEAYYKLQDETEPLSERFSEAVRQRQLELIRENRTVESSVLNLRMMCSDRQRIGRRKGALLHFTQNVGKTVYVVKILERHIVLVRSIRRKVGVLIILFQMADRIKTESAKSQIHPF